MIRLLLGSADSENSAALCRELVEAASKNISENYIIIVPEQATMQMQRKVVEMHPDHAAMNIDIVSFDRLAHKVFAEQGCAVKNVLDDTGKLLILRKVIENCRDDLLVYKNKTNSLGFIEEMKSIVTELKQYSVDDNDLFLMQESAVDNGNNLLNAKLQDIRLIYRHFNEKIAEKYTTAEEVLDIFARLAPKSEMIKKSTIYLDGFTGFTPVQYRLLERMAETSKGINIAFTLPKDKTDAACQEHELFYLSNRTFLKLSEIADRTHNKFQAAYAPEPGQKPERNVKIYAASTLEDEVIFTAKEILHLVRKNNYRFRDIAVVAGDMESYHEIIENVFHEAGIPCFVDYKSKLSDNTLARLIIAALQLGNSRMSYESVFSLLKTDMSPIDKNEVNILENYCLEFGIRGFKSWNNEFKKNKKDKWNLEYINAIREKVISLIADFYGKLTKESKRASDYSAALKELLEKWEVQEKLKEKSKEFYDRKDASKGKEYEQIYSSVVELLEKISSITGDELLSVQEYSDLLTSGLEEIKVGIIPPTLDAVMAGDLTRTRLGDIKTLFLIGVNDGKIPKVRSGSGLFTQNEREFLKEKDFEIAPTVLENLYTQRFYLYLIFAKPKERIFLSYAAFNSAGDNLSPSYMLNGLDEFGIDEYVDDIEKAPDENWKKEIYKKLAVEIRNADEKLLKFAAEREPAVLKQILAGAFFTNRNLTIDEQTALDLYGDVLKGSVSRFESFYNCPFKHFMSYGLRAEARPEYKIETADLGNIYHSSLEYYANRLKEDGLSFRDVSDDDSRRITRECVEKAINEMESGIMEDSARNEFFVNRIENIALKTTDVLRKHVKAGLFEPELFEFSFAPERIDKAEFVGKIDRVDIYEGNDIYVKIIDYKSGEKKFKIKDVYTGRELQLLAYLKQAMKKAKELYPEKEVKPGGVYFYSINDKFVNNEKDQAEKFRMSGLTSCDEGIMEAIDQNMTFERNALKSRIFNTKDIANTDEFNHLLDFVDKKIKDVSKDIRSGNISVNPYYENDSTNSCKYCDYKNVCKFDPGKYGTDWNKADSEITNQEIEREVFNRIPAEK